MDIESAAKRLAKEGYHVGLSYRIGKWHCALYNDRMSAIPTGEAKTSLLAIQAAEANRNELIKQGRQRATSK